MPDSRRLTRFEASPPAALGLQPPSRDDVQESRYRHVLVSTSLDIADRAALLLGFELASLHQSKLTLLHPLPRREPRSFVDGLDAIGLLNNAAESLRRTSAADKLRDTPQFRLCNFIKDVIPQGLLEAVNWQGECQWRNEAESIVSYVNESAVELVILSAKPFRWWLPFAPSAVRTIERRARANVIVIRG